MPALVFTPVVQAFGFVSFMVPWFFYLINLASEGKFTTHTTTIDEGYESMM